MWKGQRTDANTAFKEAFGKFRKLFEHPSERGKPSTRKALQGYYKKMGVYRNKVAEITKNRLKDEFDLGNIGLMYTDAYQKLQSVVGTRRVPPPAPIKGEIRKGEKPNEQLRRTGPRAKKKRPNSQLSRQQVEANIARGNPQVTRAHNPLNDEVIHLPNASPNQAAFKRPQ